MKKIVYLIIVLSLLMAFSCNDHLDTRNLFDKNTQNFYQTPKDIREAISGVYNALYVQTNTGLGDEQIAATLLEDLTLAGGGNDDFFAHNAAGFLDPMDDTYRELWIETYNGVYRANSIIEAIEDATFTDYFSTENEAEVFKNNTLGEAYFMRGFLMFRAARFFGGMPLINSTETPRDSPRASYSETFGQIAEDFNKAASLMEDINVNAISINDYGHANRWVAKAYLARTFLHYTGYMTNIEKSATDELILPDGSAITKTDVIGHLEDVIASGGYELVPDFRNLWPYSYVNERAGEVILPWAENEGLEWVGQDGPNSTMGTGNTEVMFAQRYAFSGWDNTKFRNWGVLFFSVRGQELVPYGQGWGWAPVHPVFYNEWPDNDPRKRGSVLDLNADDEGVEDYNPAANNGYHQTGLIIKKYIQLQHDGPQGVKGMFYYMYNPGSDSDSYMLWTAQDFYYLRYADVLLMHSELTGTADGLNQVRSRAGLNNISYSLDALKKERMYEFAFEGVRWFDLVRWGDVENSTRNYYSREASVLNNNVEATYSVKYRSEIKGLLPIPESEIRLSNGVYNQNPGW
ncbi:RagB/SusD family nutrient uptake outer membrane protein [Proteiniphilum sp. UBA5463]|jgi:hypothetical protein|uniref:RagB/SusD family nutrient uptake outer membrane protein n=1 Tax=Proteiniphilum sp. UBA5463 TaxID=1947281 RepID=UPI00258037FE|nr:RagB/SusD family nutrient uptake outer membrane protein [Proteiniphilum sp. UBA5463]